MNKIVLLKKHMETLCEIIGARPTGSVGNKVAVEYACSEFVKCGFDVQMQEFDSIDWVNSGAFLVVDGLSIPVEAAEYSLFCDVEADFVCINTVDVLEGASLSGKIVVLYGDLCKEPLMPKNFEFWNPEEHKYIISLLEEKNPKAIIMVSSVEDVFVPVIQDGDFMIPCAVVCGNALETFLKSSNRKAKLIITAMRILTKGHNVIATYGSGGKKVCFSAHIDTKFNTSGALDNASGVAVLLTLASLLAGKEYPYQFEFVLLNGEDYFSTPGEVKYMSGLSSDYVLAVNVDGVGLKGSNTSVSFYGCTRELEGRLLECTKHAKDIVQIEPWFMGDHMMFVSAGVPAMAVTASNIFDVLQSIVHTPEDTLQNIDFGVLENVVVFLLGCI